METSTIDPNYAQRKKMQNIKKLYQFLSIVKKIKPQDTYFLVDLKRRDSQIGNGIQHDLIQVIERQQNH